MLVLFRESLALPLANILAETAQAVSALFQVTSQEVLLLSAQPPGPSPLRRALIWKWPQGVTLLAS